MFIVAENTRSVNIIFLRKLQDQNYHNYSAEVNNFKWGYAVEIE